MNRLKKILLLFVLPFFCLLMSVSYAYEFGSTQMTQAGYYGEVNNTTKVGNYTLAELKTLMTNYTNGLLAFSDLEPIIDYYYNSGYNVIIANSWANSANMKTIGIIPKNVDIMSFGNPGYGFMFSSIDDNTYEGYIVSLATSWSKSHIIRTVYNGYKGNTAGDLYGNGIEFATCDIKQATNTSQSWYWDGFSYLYKTSYGTENPDESIMPTNSEIASVVQSFYDSDLYKNNTNFKDFMVVYSFVTGYYSIIGTDNHLLQEIYYDGAKPSNDDFTYPETWWRFYNYFGNVQNFFYGWNYWLYSTRKENDVFLPLEYNGVGKINDLFNLKFTNQSIIVYSSYEYEVYEFRPSIEEGGENQVTNTTVPGNEFTYDENLDPTDSNYSPIQNYIPANPSQTILGNVDFSEINKTFEENKDILNIEGASWLFTANNKLVGYFIGFLSLLIVFLIISRILGG